MAQPRRQVSKAGRNEQRKLLAAVFNNAAIAALLAGFLQPTLASLRSGHAFERKDLLATLVFSGVGFILHMAARAAASRLED